MQRNVWMRPAFQKSEAVLLPALPRRFTSGNLYLEQAVHVVAADNPFRPVEAQQAAQGQSMALSTYVRPRGSMAGRSVLRAAGLTANPLVRRSRPRYYTPRPQTIPQPSWRRFR